TLIILIPPLSLLAIPLIAFATLTRACTRGSFAVSNNQIKRNTMTEVQKLAKFVTARKYEDLSEAAVRELKIRLLDSLGCAIGALKGQPVQQIKNLIGDFGGNPLVSLI